MAKLETKPCPEPGHEGPKTEMLEVTDEQLQWYYEGALIQVAFPDLTPDQRERLLSGVCAPCWDRLFPADEEDDDA